LFPLAIDGVFLGDERVVVVYRDQSDNNQNAKKNFPKSELH